MEQQPPGTEWRVDSRVGALVVFVTEAGELDERVQPGSDLRLADLRTDKYVLVTVPETIDVDADIIAFERNGDVVWALEHDFGEVLGMLAPGQEVVEETDLVQTAKGA